MYTHIHKEKIPEIYMHVWEEERKKEEGREGGRESEMIGR
jgi:hypothetical protein